MDPSSPEEVLRHLCAVFSTFQKWWEDGEAEHLDAELGVPHHGGVRSIFWGDAVLIDGPLENAIPKCFLEHTRQVKINRVLAPY
jgi:hypothetical protein